MRFALQIRRKAVGSLLRIKQNNKIIMELQLYKESDLGQRQHTESREPYFADAAYVKADVPSRIAAQADGQCRLSDVKYSKYPQQKSCSTGNETKEVLYWECSSRCKPVSVQDIVDTKLLFEGNIPDMRKSLISDTLTNKSGPTQPAVCRFVIPLTIQNLLLRVALLMSHAVISLMRTVIGKEMTVLSLEQGTLLCAILKVVPVRANYAS